MRRITQISIFLLLAISIFGGCRKDNPVSLQAEDRYVSTSSENYWEEVFVDYWEVMNQSYVLWLEEKELDWDDIYDEFRPRFADIDEMATSYPETYSRTTELFNSNSMSYLSYGDSLALITFKEITSQLVDCHYTFTLYDLDATLAGGIYALYEREGYHDYDYSGFNSGLSRTIAAGIADGSITSYCAGTFDCGDSSYPMCLYSYCQDGDIAYFRLSSWDISGTSNSAMYRYENSKSEILENYYNIVRNTPDLKGVIIDVRNNGGGYNADMNYVIAPFLNVDDSMVIGYERHKSGPNRLDYTAYIPSTIFGASEEESLRFPIAVISDMNSYSMAEVMGFAAYAFSEDSAVIGEQSSGMTCSLCDDMILAGGLASTYNFLIYTASTLCYYGEDKTFYEGVGLVPDVEVPYDTDWGTTTVDVQKQAAIDYLRSL